MSTLVTHVAVFVSTSDVAVFVSTSDVAVFVSTSDVAVFVSTLPKKERNNKQRRRRGTPGRNKDRAEEDQKKEVFEDNNE